MSDWNSLENNLDYADCDANDLDVSTLQEMIDDMGRAEARDFLQKLSVKASDIESAIDDAIDRLNAIPIEVTDEDGDVDPHVPTERDPETIYMFQ